MGPKKHSRKGGKSQRRDGQSKMMQIKVVFYLFAPPLFANPPSCSCSEKRRQENEGQKNEKQEQPSIDLE
jgi:hypothetical protein